MRARFVIEAIISSGRSADRENYRFLCFTYLAAIIVGPERLR